jgi:Na+-transporting methylmalonyl-CoA/oxaloacetate decarboxylase gamma subunit
MAFFTLAIIGSGVVFVFFLVIVRTLGSIIHCLSKIEYWILQEVEFKREQQEIHRALLADEKEQEEGEPDRSQTPLAFPAVQSGRKPQ